MRSFVRLSFLLLITITIPTSAGAQHATSGLSGPGPSQLRGVGARGLLEPSFTLDSVRRTIRPTYWKEGALIGGVVTGAGLAFLVNGLCRSSDTSDDCGGALTAGFLVGGVLGGLAGALVGGQFPKAEDPLPPR
jgi:hypothetical protein